MMSHDALSRFADMLHHAQERLGPGDLVAPPIVPASVYFLPGDPTGPYQYGRVSNPTWDALEEALSVLEQAETVALPSGMAAIAAVLYSQLRPGDRVLLPADGYYTTRSFAEACLIPMGVQADLCPTADYDGRDLTGYRLVWIETPSNPGLDLCDIAAVAAKARAAGCLTVADNTTATPLGQRPLDLGVDAVVSSDTKAISGHSDNLMGHVASRQPALVAAVRDWRKVTGAIPGPFEAWLAHRGLETLEVRYDRMCENAQAIAERMAGHRKIRQVCYPGLPSHPAHATARKQMLRFGSLVGITFDSKDDAERFIQETKYVRPVTSFGGVHTSGERRARWGDAVADGFVRLSVGCEPLAVLWADFERAMDAL